MSLLGMIIVFVTIFEGKASTASRTLEKEYLATVAAESQFERLRAGLDVLDRETFRQRYPGLDMDYRLDKPKADGTQSAVVTVIDDEAEDRVLIRLTCPISHIVPDSAGGQP